MPVASLLEALNEGNDRTEPETFEVGHHQDKTLHMTHSVPI